MMSGKLFKNVLARGILGMAPQSSRQKAEVEVPPGVRSATGSVQRNGYCVKSLNTRAGAAELAIPKLRWGSYLPIFLCGVRLVVRRRPCRSVRCGRPRVQHRLAAQPACLCPYETAVDHHSPAVDDFCSRDG